MITTEIVDLYQSLGFPRFGASGGRLLGWIPHTPAEVSPGTRRRPAVLVIPGGGYNHLSTREAEPVALRFLARGYAAFVLEYSVGPGAYPAVLREAAMAMRFIRENAGRMEVDTGMIAAVGFSAGGHLAGLLGTLYDADEVRDIGSAEEIRPDALGLCYPVTVSWGKPHAGSFRFLTGEDAALTEQLSLERLIRRDMPPVFLWHTRDDETVPVWGTLVLAKALEEAGVDFTLHIFHRGVHGLSTADRQAYPMGKLPDVSQNIRNWPEMAMDFWEETGFTITDMEG